MSDPVPLTVFGIEIECFARPRCRKIAQCCSSKTCRSWSHPKQRSIIELTLGISRGNGGSNSQDSQQCDRDELRFVSPISNSIQIVSLHAAGTSCPMLVSRSRQRTTKGWKERCKIQVRLKAWSCLFAFALLSDQTEARLAARR